MRVIEASVQFLTMFLFQAHVAKNANNSRVLSQVTLLQGIFQLKTKIKFLKTK